jgi:multicomponent Na+:H+ antiporter subunit F
MTETLGLVPWVVRVVLVLTTLGLTLSVIRLVRGPSLPDRVVALDLFVTQAVGLIAAASIATGDQIPLRPALVLALVAFLGTVAFAQYVEKGTK